MQTNNDFDYSQLQCYVVKTKDGVQFKHLKQDPTGEEFVDFIHLSSIANFYHERILYYFGIWYMQKINKFDNKLVNELLYLWLNTTSYITNNERDHKRWLPFFQDIVDYIEGEENAEKAEELTNEYYGYVESYRDLLRTRFQSC